MALYILWVILWQLKAYYFIFSDSSHLQQPIHAGVLLRIESTTSESNSDNRQASPQAKIDDSNLNIIENTESMEVMEVRSDDEG